MSKVKRENKNFNSHFKIPELDNEWTKEETDYLLNLCRKYDLRFIVIADRYEYSNTKSRSIEVKY